MKHSTSLLLASVGVLTLALSACSTSSASDDAGTTAPASPTAAVEYSGGDGTLPAAYGEPEIEVGYDFTIGWLTGTMSAPFVKEVYEAGQRETERLGGTFIGLDAELSADTQVSQCNQLVAQRVTAIAVYPVDPAALQPCFDEATSLGIPIIGQDTPPEAGAPLLPNYVSTVLQGVDYPRFLTAENAATLAPAAEYATLGINIPAPLLQYSMDRAEHWADAEGLAFTERVDAQGVSSGAAADAMNTILTRHPDVKVVFTYTDSAASAAANALAAAGATDVLVYGISGEQSTIDLIASDSGVTGTALLDAEQVGVQQVWGLYNTLTEQNLPLAPQVSPKSVLVTKDNASDVAGLG
jgi:ABC-type sugar transport system substrate-binding protein